MEDILKRCKDCGKYYQLSEYYTYEDKRGSKDNTKKYFTRCRKCEAVRQTTKRKIKTKVVNDRAVTENTLDIERINKEAWKSGMSYGQYVAMQELKKQKQLKERARILSGD